MTLRLYLQSVATSSATLVWQAKEQVSRQRDTYSSTGIGVATLPLNWLHAEPKDILLTDSLHGFWPTAMKKEHGWIDDDVETSNLTPAFNSE